MAANKFCRKIDCGLELRYFNKIKEGCVPVYFQTSACCPIDFKCRKLNCVISISHWGKTSFGTTFAYKVVLRKLSRGAFQYRPNILWPQCQQLGHLISINGGSIKSSKFQPVQSSKFLITIIFSSQPIR